MSNAFNKKLSKISEAYKRPDHPNKPKETPPTSSRLFNLDLHEDEIFKIDLKDIAPNPKNIRTDNSWKEDQDFKNLVENIELMGLQQNLVVRRSNAGDACQTPYILISGHRRFEALKMLQKKHPEDLRFAYAWCLIVSYAENPFLDADLAEELAIVSTNVEIRGLTNAEQIAAVEIYEKAYEAIRKKIKALKKEAQDPVSKKWLRKLTPTEKELIDAVEGCTRSRDFAANALNISARKISNLRRINHKLIDPYRKAFLNDHFSTEAAILLAGQETSVQNLFKKTNRIPIENLSKADIETFLLRLKTEQTAPEKNRQATLSAASRTVNLKNDLQQSFNQIKSGEQLLSSAQYQKYLRYTANIEKEIAKLKKLILNAEC